MRRLGLFAILLLFGVAVEAVEFDEFGLLLDLAPPPAGLGITTKWMTSIGLYSDLLFRDIGRLRLSLGTPAGRWVFQLGVSFAFSRDQALGWSARLDTASVPDGLTTTELALGGRLRILDSEVWRIGAAMHPLLIRRYDEADEGGWNLLASANATVEVSFVLADRVVVGQAFRIALADSRPCGEPLLPVPWETGIVTHLTSSIGLHVGASSAGR